MNVILLGYCANLAYVIHGNEAGTSFEINLCRFGMVLFGIVSFYENIWR